MSWANFNIPPTISEVAVDERLQLQQQQNVAGGNGSTMMEDFDEADASIDTIQALQNSKLEPLMISMLEQRDKLQEQMVRMQRRIEETEERCRESDRERESVKRQLETTRQNMPSELQTLTRELAQCREQLFEKEEEIVELKAERNNTRLLLEHLECLVSKHEKSLRFTVVKRHSQANRDSSVSSEVEVLKALKSLFEHHKALEEKVRERLKVAIERVQSLEVELNARAEENGTLKSKLAKAIAEAEEHAKQLNGESSSNKMASSNGEAGESNSTSAAASSAKICELQEQLDMLSRELTSAMSQANEMNTRKCELETELSKAEKEMRQAREQAHSAEHQLQELQAQRDEQENRANTLENRIMAAQREAACLRDLNDKLEFQLANKDAAIRLNEEKVHSLQERLELAEKQLAQSLKKAESLPSVEAELLQRMEALSAAEQKHLSAEDRIQRLEACVEERNAELERAVQRERMNEEHNKRLSSTVDKLLSESNERLQIHLKERMQAQIERNKLMQQLDQAKKLFDQAERFKERALNENEDLRKEIEMLRNLVYSTRTAQFYSRLNGFPSGPPFTGGSTAQIAAASSIPTLDNSDMVEQQAATHPTAASYILPPRQHNMTSSMPNMVKRRMQKGRVGAMADDPNKVQTLGEQEWDRIQQANVLANVQQAFSNSSASLLNLNNSQSPQQPSDPQALAYVLQERLDAINNEIRIIQEQKQQAEQMEQQSSAVWPQNSIGMDGSVYSNAIQQQQQQQYSPYIAGAATYANQQQQQQEQQQREQMMNKYNAQQQQMHYNEMVTTAAAAASASSSGMYGATVMPNGIGQQVYGIDEFSSISQQQHRRRFSSRREMMRRSGDCQHEAGGSPISSMGSSPELADNPATAFETNGGGGRAGKPPKKSTSTSSGLRTLGRIFGSQRKKSLEQQRRLEGVALSDSEYGLPEIGGSVDNLTMAMRARHNQQRQLVNGTTGGGSQTFAMTSSSTSDFDKRKRKKHELLEEAIKARTPFALWNGPTVVAWLELWVGMPTWYTEACRANVKSGAIMSALSDQEIQREIGVSNPLHRLKLRLAIQEMVALTSPSSPRTQHYTGLAFGDMNHEWVGNEWLPALGLGKYRQDFMECLVDARMLEHLSKRDLNKSLKMLDSFHRTSLHYGIVCLKILNYDRKQLEERRRACENVNKDLMVWSNERVCKWLEEIGLGMFASNLVDSGVHGALMALDETFDVPVLSHILQIPEGDPAFGTLNKQFEQLVVEFRREGPTTTAASGATQGGQQQQQQQMPTTEKGQKSVRPK